MDTIAVNVLSDNSFLLNIIDKLIPGLFTLIGAYLGFRYGLKKDRIRNKEEAAERINKLKFFVHFSVDELIKSSESQLKYIEDFKVQFQTNEIDIKPIYINASFSTENFSSISKIDFYTLFVENSDQEQEIKAKAFSNFNFSLKVTQKISENIELDMNKYRKRINEWGDQYNKLSSEIRNHINEIVKNSENEGLRKELNKHNSDKLNPLKLYDIHYMITEFYNPLIDIGKRYKVDSFIQVVPNIMNVYKQIEGAKVSYFNIYDNFAEQIKLSINELQNVKTFLEKGN